MNAPLNSDREAALFGVLRIGHATSMRGPGLSLRDALERATYVDLRSKFGADDLVPILDSRPSLIEEWVAYSEDKRTSGGWYLLRSCEIGTVETPKQQRRFSSMSKAVAGFVVAELDFWARLTPAR